jgi:GTP-binding protein YchF
MKVTLIGLPQAGQQQLFCLLTGIPLDIVLQKPTEAHLGICEVRDTRITTLQVRYHPQKTTYAKIEFLLLPDLNLQSAQKDQLINQLKNADEICLTVKQQGAAAEIQNFISELIIFDLMLIEKRLQTIEKEKSKTADTQKEKDLLERCKNALDQEKLLSTLLFDAEQKKALRTYQFFTLKPMVIVINVPEDKINDQAAAAQIKAKYNLPAIQVSAELEEEISRLAESEKTEFMHALGIAEPAINKMTRVVFEGLGLISFFTVGEDEVRAWPIPKGSLAPEAGGIIHSDIAKGFIRAEMMKYTDLIEAGSENKLKETGRFYLKGKDYVVEDGDILSFRFNV